MGKKIDMTGWIMKEHGVPNSQLIVLEEDKEYKKIHNILAPHIYWKCQCSCGKIFSVSGVSIRQGHTLSCGCFKIQQLKQNNHTHLIGQKFNRLLVLEDDGTRNGDGKILWKCLCDCGNITYATSYQLQSNIKQSCGCYKKEITSQRNAIDISGKRFGKLIAIKYLYTNKNCKRVYLCKCDCGNECEVTSNSLTRGDTTSCGCIVSKGENKIKEILNDNNISFKAEYSYDDCLSPKGYRLRYDFYVNDTFLLEFDGKQHYESGWENDFEYTKICDNIKNEYAKLHNIPLKRIPYWDINKITIENIMDDTYLIT